MTEEQTMLRDQTRRALAEAYSKADLRAGKASEPDFVSRLWTYAADMGWTGIIAPESAGGLALGLSDAAILGEEFGRALFPAPYTDTAIVTALLASSVAGDRGHRILHDIAAGHVRVALADNASRVAAGQWDIVEYPSLATHILILAQTAGGGFSAALVSADSPGVKVTARQPLDVTCPIGSVAIDQRTLSGALLCEVGPVEAKNLEAARTIMVAAELSGIAAAALDLAVAYANERKQFGVPIGSFQAIKHKLADGFVMIESARAATRYAAEAFDEAATDRDVAAEAAIRVAGEAALRNAGDCVQVHGALGFSWEHDAHLYLKRARRLAATFGRSRAKPSAIATLLASAAQGKMAELFAPIAMIEGEGERS
jgi:alkylation response protein AidB-like acyl-CoA dehydrogenase